MYSTEYTGSKGKQRCPSVALVASYTSMKFSLAARIPALALLCIAASFALAVHGQTHPDQVTSLPGLKSTLEFQHFAGYLNVNSTHNRNLFYWFTKATNSSTDLVLWLNGGPGCSSVSGFFTENGPFVVNSNGNIKLNDYAWNTRANVLWLEAPAGVSPPRLLHFAQCSSDFNSGRIFLQRRQG